MIKRVPYYLLAIAILQASSTFLIALGLYFLLYPSFFILSYPANLALNLLWLFLLTPFIFECFLLQQALYAKSREVLEIFYVRLFFGILIKALYIFTSLLSATKGVSLMQARLFYTFLACILLDGIKAYLLLSCKRRSSQ